MQRCATTLTSCSLQFDKQFRLTLCGTSTCTASSFTKTLLSVSFFECLYCLHCMHIHTICDTLSVLQACHRHLAFSNFMSSFNRQPPDMQKRCTPLI
jgi:hypothetical protein